MTVKELINELKKWPEDLIVAVYHEPFEDIILKKCTWIHSNYPYDKPDVDYLSLE